MRYQEILEMATQVIDDIEFKWKNKFRPLGINIVFTQHFRDRLTDGNVDKAGRARDNISEEEMETFFVHLTKSLALLKMEITEFHDEVARGRYEAVITDTLTKLNVPCNLTFDRNSGRFKLTFFTIMKKNRFVPNNANDHQIIIPDALPDIKSIVQPTATSQPTKPQAVSTPEVKKEPIQPIVSTATQSKQPSTNKSKQKFLNRFNRNKK